MAKKKRIPPTTPRRVRPEPDDLTQILCAALQIDDRAKFQETARPLALQWRVVFQARGATEGDNHRARVAIETLGHLLSEDDCVRQQFSVLMTRHAKPFMKGLGEYADPVHTDIRAKLNQLVMVRLGTSYEAVGCWLYLSFLSQITNPDQRRVTVTWNAEPVPPPDLPNPDRGETLESYVKRIQQAAPVPLDKGRKPRSAGCNLQQYVQFFYELKWCQTVTQYGLAKSYATARGLTGDHRGHVRTAVEEVDALLRLLAPPFRIFSSL